MSATSPLSAKTPVRVRQGRMEPADIGEGQRPSLSEAPAHGGEWDDFTAVHNTTDSVFQELSIVKEEIKAEIMEEMKEEIEEEVKGEIQEEIDEDIESEGKEEVYSLEAELPFLPWTPDEDPLSVSALQSLVKEENLRCQLPSSSEDFFGFTEVDRDKNSKPIPKGSELLVYYGDDSAPRELTVHSETSGESVTPSPAGPSSSGIGGALRCPHCDYRCSEQPCLDGHLKTRHGDVVRIGRFHCEWCLYSSDSSARIKRHRKSHTSERPYGCTTCSTRFNSRASLIRHMRIHTGEKPHGCYICKARFFRRSNLNTHMRTHTAERPFSCPFCPARFVFQSSVNRHLRTHTEHLPYGCSVCSARFGHQADLNKHKRTHIEERPYGCSVCAARFYIRSDLIGHMRTHTGERISLTKHTSLPTN
ncbi:zinc finger protein 771-like isoform X2 [Amphibalanus amphitrite]|uniref:zinc finger protein 771-like isoform X2 n=1 Tax=Amphibalanus amphitrite TaxID=1232801 RepID=UPI001C925D62|nr:zinc finger protein 771-like isoform X2 [Amphibalanus amphitrite]XP_043233201.1 zinc finger protein 771-like isoform X2 [Amphibalanus amphitrite]XP_043233202.1 zinc finger protein 771-like isoform X2 [Amphibalanus amphitrite]XP_043233203.1 zinc finger protein 771-like isoform X2 [Amphibalanus amphitrite]XP_043233204.1 zinc finger protein 771-like isoform X2 [Amphibalanus amphitrite]